MSGAAGDPNVFRARSVERPLVEGEAGLFLGDDLELLELIGRGGSGAVYRARDMALDRRVAVKILRGVFGADPIEALTEARVQASVGWHSNVLTVFRHGVTIDGWPYLVLEDAAGGSLKDRVMAEGPCAVDEVLRFSEELIDALGVAHQAGIIHRDVKPSNVLFATDGSVRLADFGAAMSSTTQTLDFLEGSLVFAPPELLEGRRPSEANDVYGIAVTIWFALTGEIPFGGIGQPAASAIARIHTEELRFEGLGLTRDWKQVLERCAGKDPSHRPSLAELSSELHRAGRSRFGIQRRTLPEHESNEHCSVLQESISRRRTVIGEIIDDMEKPLPAVEVVRRLLHLRTDQSARAMKLLVDIATRDCPTLRTRSVSLEDLRRLVIGDVVLMLSGNPSLVARNEPLSIGPQYLQQVSAVVSEAYRWAAGECPEVDVDMSDLWQERGWVLLSKFADPAFLDEFFESESSFEVFEPHMMSILLSVGRGFFEALLRGRGEWVLAGLTGRPDIRRMIAFDHPFVVLMVLADEPQLADRVDEHLRRGLQLGLSRMTASERAGIRSVYAAELEAIGLSI